MRRAAGGRAPGSVLLVNPLRPVRAGRAHFTSQQSDGLTLCSSPRLCSRLPPPSKAGPTSRTLLTPPSDLAWASVRFFARLAHPPTVSEKIQCSLRPRDSLFRARACPLAHLVLVWWLWGLHPVAFAFLPPGPALHRAPGGLRSALFAPFFGGVFHRSGWNLTSK